MHVISRSKEFSKNLTWRKFLWTVKQFEEKIFVKYLYRLTQAIFSKRGSVKISVQYEHFFFVPDKIHLRHRLAV